MTSHETTTDYVSKTRSPWLREDSVMGIVLAILTLFFLFYLIPNYIEEPHNLTNRVMSPRFVPQIAGWSILLLALLLVRQGVKNDSKKQSAPLINTPPLRWILMVLSFVVYALFFEWLGAVTSAFIASCFLLVANYIRRFWIYVLMLVFPAAVFALFVYVLYVPLPWGEVWY